MKPEQKRVKDLIADTLLLLCKNGLNFVEELRIEGVIGITLDNKDVFLVHVDERLNSDNDEVVSKNHADEEKISDSGTERATNGIIPPVTNHQAEGLGNAAPGSKRRSGSKEAPVSNSDEDSRSVIKVEEEDTNRDANFQRPAPSSTHWRRRRGRPPKRPYPTSSLEAGEQLVAADQELYEPDLKRFNPQGQILNDTGYRLTLGEQCTDQQVWSQLADYTSQAATATAIEVMGEGHSPQAGCSTWIPGLPRGASTDPFGSPAPPEAKYPSHALQSHNIKEALAFGLVDPIVEADPAARFMSFRLSWFGTDVSHLDKVWQNIATLQEQMDQFIGSAPGVKVLVSAYTGTLSGRTTKTDTPGLRVSYPGLAYWLLSETEVLDERLFMRQLHEHAFGARIKSLLYEHEQTKEKVTNALFVVLKDCTGGFVRRKVDESVSLCTSSDRDSRPHEALVRIWVKDESYWEQMRAAQDRLKSASCDVSLHRL